MKAEATLQYMSDFYPRIFPTRKHALNQLFCVLGNGMEWVNGELINKDSKYLKRYKMIEEIERAEFPDENQWNEMHDFYVDLYESCDKNEKIPIEYQFEWYPLCTGNHGSKLYNYPEDIKPDWKALIEECKELLRKDGIHVEEVNYGC